MINDKLKRSTFVVAMGTIIATFILSRVANLDADAPTFFLAFYSTPDEMYWTIAAFNLFHHGSWIFRPFEFLPPDELPFTQLQNFLTFLSLELFGNNFFGLRMPAVFCGAVVAASTLYCIWDRAAVSEWRAVVTMLCAIYLLADFFFLQSNRFNEPTIFSMATIALGMVLVCKSGNSVGRSALAVSALWGALAAASVVFVYVYNVFFAAALGVTLLAVRAPEGRNSVIRHAAAFSLGATLVCVLFVAFLQTSYHMDVASYVELMKGIGGHGTNRVPPSDPLSLLKLLFGNFPIALYQTLSHNLFRYNVLLLFLFLAALPTFVLVAARERRPLDILVVAFLVFRLGGSVLVPFDWYERKLVQLFPAVIYVIGTTFSRDVQIFDWKRLRPTPFTFAVIAAAAIAYWVMKSELPHAHRSPEYIAQSEFWIGLLIFPFVFLPKWWVRRCAVAALFGLLLIPNLRMSIQFVYGKPTFYYRDALIASAPALDGKILAGGASYAVRLYNSSTPVINFYNYYHYGSDRFFALSKRMYESRLAAGTVLYIPFMENPFIRPIHDYVSAGELVLSRELQIGPDERLGLFLVPAQPRNE